MTSSHQSVTAQPIRVTWQDFCNKCMRSNCTCPQNSLGNFISRPTLPANVIDLCSDEDVIWNEPAPKRRKLTADRPPERISSPAAAASPAVTDDSPAGLSPSLPALPDVGALETNTRGGTSHLLVSDHSTRLPPLSYRPATASMPSLAHVAVAEEVEQDTQPDCAPLENSPDTAGHRDARGPCTARDPSAIPTSIFDELRRWYCEHQRLTSFPFAIGASSIALVLRSKEGHPTNFTCHDGTALDVDSFRLPALWTPATSRKYCIIATDPSGCGTIIDRCHGIGERSKTGIAYRRWLGFRAGTEDGFEKSPSIWKTWHGRGTRKNRKMVGNRHKLHSSPTMSQGHVSSELGAILASHTKRWTPRIPKSPKKVDARTGPGLDKAKCFKPLPAELRILIEQWQLVHGCDEVLPCSIALSNVWSVFHSADRSRSSSYYHVNGDTLEVWVCKLGRLAGGRDPYRAVIVANGPNTPECVVANKRHWGPYEGRRPPTYHGKIMIWQGLKGLGEQGFEPEPSITKANDNRAISRLLTDPSATREGTALEDEDTGPDFDDFLVSTNFAAEAPAGSASHSSVVSWKDEHDVSAQGEADPCNSRGSAFDSETNEDITTMLLAASNRSEQAANIGKGHQVNSERSETMERTTQHPFYSLKDLIIRPHHEMPPGCRQQINDWFARHPDRPFEDLPCAFSSKKQNIIFAHSSNGPGRTPVVWESEKSCRPLRIALYSLYHSAPEVAETTNRQQAREILVVHTDHFLPAIVSHTSGAGSSHYGPDGRLPVKTWIGIGGDENGWARSCSVVKRKMGKTVQPSIPAHPSNGTQCDLADRSAQPGSEAPTASSCQDGEDEDSPIMKTIARSQSSGHKIPRESDHLWVTRNHVRADPIPASHSMPAQCRSIINEWYQRHPDDPLILLPCIIRSPDISIRLFRDGSTVLWVDRNTGDALEMVTYLLAETHIPCSGAQSYHKIIVVSGPGLASSITANNSDTKKNNFVNGLMPVKRWIGLQGDANGWETNPRILKCKDRESLVRFRQSLGHKLFDAIDPDRVSTKTESTNSHQKYLDESTIALQADSESGTEGLNQAIQALPETTGIVENDEQRGISSFDESLVDSGLPQSCRKTIDTYLRAQHKTPLLPLPFITASAHSKIYTTDSNSSYISWRLTATDEKLRVNSFSIADPALLGTAPPRRLFVVQGEGLAPTIVANGSSQVRYIDGKMPVKMWVGVSGDSDGWEKHICSVYKCLEKHSQTPSTDESLVPHQSKPCPAFSDPGFPIPLDHEMPSRCRNAINEYFLRNPNASMRRPDFTTVSSMANILRPSNTSKYGRGYHWELQATGERLEINFYRLYYTPLDNGTRNVRLTVLTGPTLPPTIVANSSQEPWNAEGKRPFQLWIGVRGDAGGWEHSASIMKCLPGAASNNPPIDARKTVIEASDSEDEIAHTAHVLPSTHASTPRRRTTSKTYQSDDNTDDDVLPSYISQPTRTSLRQQQNRAAASAPASTISLEGLNPHLQNNLVFLFYPSSTTSDMPRVRLFSACDTVQKLFAQAMAGSVFDSKISQRVLSVRVDTIQGKQAVLTLKEDDEAAFDKVLAAVSRTGWFSQGNDQTVADEDAGETGWRGSGTVEVRAKL